MGFSSNLNNDSPSKIHFRIVDLPTPDGPTKTTFFVSVTLFLSFDLYNWDF